jgi:cytoskeletal protein CcmA (bactofilin family)
MKEKGLNGFLDKGTFFKGEVHFDDLLRVDGKFEGTIKSESELVVGETAEIKGTVDVGSATINGFVDGLIKVKTRLELHAKAVVKGEIDAPVLIVQEGALFNGTCKMGNNKSENNNKGKK